eukprot:05088.XXX_109887_110012_1 [CDS] Oithona nana genome sequencing.
MRFMFALPVRRQTPSFRLNPMVSVQGSASINVTLSFQIACH